MRGFLMAIGFFVIGTLVSAQTTYYDFSSGTMKTITVDDYGPDANINILDNNTGEMQNIYIPVKEDKYGKILHRKYNGYGDYDPLLNQDTYY